MSNQPQSTAHQKFDIVIIGGAMMGSAAAWFLSHHPQFDGRILVIERDPSYAFCSTSHTHSCLRQQYSSAINIKIAQFAVDMVRRFKHHMNDPAAPDLRYRLNRVVALVLCLARKPRLNRNCH